MQGSQSPEDPLRAGPQAGGHPPAAGDEILGPLQDDPQLFQAVVVQGPPPPGGQDPPGSHGADARDPEKGAVVGSVHLHGEFLQVVHGPVALGVQAKVQVGAVRGEKLVGPEVVEPQQPVRLVQPVLPQQGRLEVQGGGQQGALRHGDVGGEKDPLEPVCPVHPLGELENVAVGLVGGPHDHLGGLPRRGKGGRVAVFHLVRLVGQDAVPDLLHGPEDVVPGLVRSQQGQAPGGGQLDVHRKPVRQPAQPLGQRRVRPGDGLGVDVTGEVILLPEDGQGVGHPLRGVVRVPHHRGAEEKALDVVAPVEVHGQVRQLPGGEHGPGQVVGGPVDAVPAVVAAHVGHQDLQQTDAPPVGGEGVTAPRRHGLPQPAPGPVPAAGGAGHVVLGGVGEDLQLFRDGHGPLPSSLIRTFVLFIGYKKSPPDARAGRTKGPPKREALRRSCPAFGTRLEITPWGSPRGSHA